MPFVSVKKLSKPCSADSTPFANSSCSVLNHSLDCLQGWLFCLEASRSRWKRSGFSWSSQQSFIKETLYYYWRNIFIWNVMGKSIMLIMLPIIQINNKRCNIIHSILKVTSMCFLGCNYKIYSTEQVFLYKSFILKVSMMLAQKIESLFPTLLECQLI